jgi:hypothetical protein
MRWTASLIFLALVLGCGGGKKKAAGPMDIPIGRSWTFGPDDGTADLGQPTSELTEQNVHVIVSKIRPQALECLHKYLPRPLTEDRELIMVIAFDPAGKIVVGGGASGDTTADACLEALAKGLTFPPSTDGKATSVGYRFLFKTGE